MSSSHLIVFSRQKSLCVFFFSCLRLAWGSIDRYPDVTVILSTASDVVTGPPHQVNSIAQQLRIGDDKVDFSAPIRVDCTTRQKAPYIMLYVAKSEAFVLRSWQYIKEYVSFLMRKISKIFVFKFSRIKIENNTNKNMRVLGQRHLRSQLVSRSAWSRLLDFALPIFSKLLRALRLRKSYSWLCESTRRHV